MKQRVTIFTGHFGSGKTELSIREAVARDQYMISHVNSA